MKNTLETFLKEYKSTLYRRKERIILPGENTNYVFYLAQGFVTQSILSPNGNQFTPYIFAPQTFFPLIWPPDEEIDNYEYESLTPVEVSKIPKEELSEYLKINPQAAGIFNRQLTNYSLELLKKLETRVFSDAFHLVVLTLLDLIKLFGKYEDRTILIEYWFTHHDIANISGLSREVVTKQMTKLAEKKLISYKSHFIVIDDFKALKTELEI